MVMGTVKGKGIGTTLLKTLCAGAAAFALLVSAAVNAWADDTLSCYKGPKEYMVLIGEISGANLQNAAAECNSFYGDCNGQCIGCYMDENSSMEVCMDSEGNRFNR